MYLHDNLNTEPPKNRTTDDAKVLLVILTHGVDPWGRFAPEKERGGS